MFKLQTSFNPLLLGGGGGGGAVKSVVEVTVNIKEENFCTFYVPEFGLQVNLLQFSFYAADLHLLMFFLPSMTKARMLLYLLHSVQQGITYPLLVKKNTLPEETNLQVSNHPPPPPPQAKVSRLRMISSSSLQVLCVYQLLSWRLGWYIINV
jgi:hypothetical protein